MRIIILLLLPFCLFGQTGIFNTIAITDDLDFYYNIHLAQIYMGSEKGRITFTKKWPLQEGAHLIAKISKDKTCLLKILELGEKEGKVSLSHCPFRSELKRDQILSLPPMVTQVDPTYRENSVYTAEKKAIGDLPSQNEPWYIYTSIGLAPIQYASSINQSIESFTGNSSMNNLGISLEAFGAYFPLKNKKTVLGGVLGLVYENYKTQGQFNESPTTVINQWADLKFWQYSITASAMHFYGRNVGDGFFIRGDLGISAFQGTLNVSYTTNGGDLQGENQDFSYKWGPSFLLGGGYSWPISLSERMMASLYFSSKSSYSNGTLTTNNMIIAGLGFLF